MTLATPHVSAGATPASQDVEKTKEGAVKTKDAVVKGTKIAADKTKDGLSKTGEVMTDGWITTRVHARFVDEDLLKGSDISVDTEQARRDAEGHRHGEGRACPGDDCCAAHGRRASSGESADHRAEAEGLAHIQRSTSDTGSMNIWTLYSMALTRPLGLALLGTLLACASVHGQNSQAPPPDLTRFNTEIVVTPERGETPRALVPAASVVLDETSLIALPTTHPSEILRFLPGFNVARPDFYAGRPVVSSRGFFGGGEAEYISLLVDGVPVADIESGLIDWAIVPASAIRRVEAVRGPGASLYGDSAIGGVIQILTDRTTRGGQATATGGSFNTVLVDGSYSARSGGIGFSISGAARRTDGGFEHSGGRELVGGGSAEGGFERILVALERIGRRAEARRPWRAQPGRPGERSLFVRSALSFRQRRPPRLLDGVYPPPQHPDLETADPFLRHDTRRGTHPLDSPCPSGLR